MTSKSFEAEGDKLITSYRVRENGFAEGSAIGNRSCTGVNERDKKPKYPILSVPASQSCLLDKNMWCATESRECHNKIFFYDQ
jgi:hypothetical protein